MGLLRAAAAAHLLFTIAAGGVSAQDVPVLAGVVVSPDPARSVAVLRSGERTRIVLAGETAFGARVVRVAADSVQVEIDGAVHELRLAAGPPTSDPAPPITDVASPAPGTAPREYERAELQRRIASEAARILAETTLVPVWDAGQVAGFTLSRVPEGTVLSDAGLQPGDVLTHVNGTPVDSLATLVALWPRLQGAAGVQADLLRGGQPIRIDIKLK